MSLRLSLSDLSSIKAKSEAEARRLGYPTLDSLPFIVDEGDVTLRSTEEVVDRALVMNVVTWRTYDMPQELARELLEKENLQASLSGLETRYLAGEDDDAAYEFYGNVEAKWALVWALSFIPTLDFAEYCGDNLVSILPDLREIRDFGAFRAAAELRDPLEIVQAADLAYRLHWAVVEASLTGRPTPGAVEGYVIESRRHALDWIVRTDESDFHEMSLDT
jgi:hypothetical protein